MSIESHELYLYAVNTGDLYRRFTRPRVESLARQVLTLAYSDDAALIGWTHIARRAAKMYVREHATPEDTIFSDEDIAECGRELMEYYREQIRDHLEEIAPLAFKLAALAREAADCITGPGENPTAHARDVAKALRGLAAKIPT